MLGFTLHHRRFGVYFPMMAETDGMKVVLITDAENERLLALSPEWLQGEKAVSKRVRRALGLHCDSVERERTETAAASN